LSSPDEQTYLASKAEKVIMRGLGWAKREKIGKFRWGSNNDAEPRGQGLPDRRHPNLGGKKYKQSCGG
jgi:hypothetical protein